MLILRLVCCKDRWSMTDKQLRRVKKLELLEIMIAQDKEIDGLQKRLDESEEKLKEMGALLEKCLTLMTQQQGFIERLTNGGE